MCTQPGHDEWGCREVVVRARECVTANAEWMAYARRGAGGMVLLNHALHILDGEGLLSPPVHIDRATVDLVARTMFTVASSNPADWANPGLETVREHWRALAVAALGAMAIGGTG